MYPAVDYPRSKYVPAERLYANTPDFDLMSTTVRIVKTPEVLHGKPRIEGTRVGVLQVGDAVREAGWTVEEATEQFDLDREQIEAALDYYDDNPEVVETLHAQQSATYQQLREQSRAE